MKTLGLCIGASNISLVLLEKDGKNNISILDSKTMPHEGNPRNTITKMISSSLLHTVDRIAVTGRKLKSKLKASSISEPEAMEYALKHMQYYEEKEDFKKDIDVVVSAGGETFMVYQVDQEGRVINVYTGSKCASGTGEFFLQQIKRMNINAEEAVLIADMENPYKVAGRCSVFCKSDCTHALNKGASKERVVAGLSDMMALKIMELLKKIKHEKVAVVGGVSANTAMINFLKKEVPYVYIPEHAKYFEALGAALWAMEEETRPIESMEDLFTEGESAFTFLPAIKDYLSKVTFKETIRQEANEGDVCIIGLDVGSTTTKAVLMRKEDNAILASCYLRTNGDPIQASRQCYGEILKQLKHKIQIIGLGVTGSGRQIAGLHALTPAVINEIIAHATAAVYFDPEVDTIFEIGGQDAKYTYITNGVACDYAMNEACSAGTGSFLEEAAKESLFISTEEIGDIALNSSRPPNFSDQCAAFISSDIKSAIQEGIGIEDLAAGLVYSICMNYINRVKGSRAVGNKVFMQGGVCYNKAVPIAMAALTGKEIIVPPEPGLMGAFGVALELKNKMELGLLQPMTFDLEELAEREVTYGNSFICLGGKEKCDRKCTINMIDINGNKYPFGGACNKYVNMIQDKKEINMEKMDLVNLREKLVFQKFGVERSIRLLPANQKTVGLNYALLTHTLFPLYYNFFTALGFDVVYSEDIDEEGVERRASEFCYPVEIAHGTLMGLIKKKPDIYFLPHVNGMLVENGTGATVTCPLVQAEPYYLKTTFSELDKEMLLTPVFNFSKGFEKEQRKFVDIAKKLGIDADYAQKAYVYAVQAQKDFHAECAKIGKEFLEELEKNPNEIAIVLFGRPYNAFTKKANMGIPQKFVTREYRIIPHDFLPYQNEETTENMYWALGQIMMKSAQYVKRHPQLFATYITNFSCGPDSFLVGYFRKIMDQKPSLTLELDSHTADAGLDTRIEAFLDVIKSYIEMSKTSVSEEKNQFKLAEVVTEKGNTWVVDSKGEKYALNHPKVHILIPSMGDLSSRLLAASLRFIGIHATTVPAPTAKELRIGKGYASCKECLPLILTVGSLIDYLDYRKKEDELLVYFMPDTSGPCRFGQYNILMKNVLEKKEIEDVALISLTSENSYAGFGNDFTLRAWQSIIIGDVMEEIYSAVLTIAKNKSEAMKVYESVCELIIKSIEKDNWSELKQVIREAAKTMSKIEKIRSVEETPKIALIGEIYVRRDGFSRQYLIERLAKEGIIVRTAPIAEWIYYCDYLVKNKYSVNSNLKDRIRTFILQFFKHPFEKTIKEIFAESGFYHKQMIDIEKMINNVKDLISPELTGEAILTAGSAITEVIEEVSGVISIGPFSCMPARIAESVINVKMNDKKREIAEDKELVEKVMKHYPALPFLAIETDGNAFPQVIEAKLEIFCLQVARIHNKIEEIKEDNIRRLS
jgi:predicted CoA-substrate-specific enzyme activase